MLARWMNNDELAGIIRILSFYPFADMISQLINPALISIGRVGYSAMFGLIFSHVRIFSIIWPVAAHYSLPGVMKVMVTAAFGTAIVGVVMIILILGVRQVLVQQGASLGAACLFACRWRWLGVGLIGRQLDKWIISIFFSPEQYAIFSNGAMELPLVGVLAGGLAAAILPAMVKSASENRAEDAISLWQRTSRVCALVMFPSFVLSLLLAPELIVLMFSTKYTDSTYPFIVYLFVLPLRVVVFNSLLRAFSHTAPIIIGAVLAIAVNAALGIGFVSSGGPRNDWFFGTCGCFGCESIFVGMVFALCDLEKLVEFRFRNILPWGDLTRLLCFLVRRRFRLFLLYYG